MSENNAVNTSAHPTADINELENDVTTINGIGKARAKCFEKLGVFTIRDLLYFFPRAYENRGDTSLLFNSVDDKAHAFVLTVGNEPRNSLIRRGMALTKFKAFDESGSVEIVFFNQTYLKSVFTKGASFRFWGKIARNKNVYQISSPKFEPIIEGVPLPDFIPIYSLTEGLTQKNVSEAVNRSLIEHGGALRDYLPEHIRLKMKLPTLISAIRCIHNPESKELLSLSLKRIAFDEMLMFSLGNLLSYQSHRKQNGIPMKECDFRPLTNSLPFALTPSQKQVCREIVNDMTRVGAPMNRILIGDVGSGKTVCAIIAMYLVAQNGYQAALMVPTEILANQHYRDISALFESLGLKTALLTGSLTTTQKNAIYKGLSSCGPDRIDVVIGTHALLSDKITFSNLGITITDEQHRFGVLQRAALKSKNENAHLLVMSATPIPRTLALALYGNLDISKIEGLPSGRQRVGTFFVNNSYRERLHGFIRKQVSEGGQVYIVCPSIEEVEVVTNEEGDEGVKISDIISQNYSNEALPIKAASVYVRELREEVFPDLRIELIHGKLKQAEKDSIMRDFSNGDIDILVSTTVIEVGVNVPNASLMIVENAERFGLSQLHQLRGRVGRGSKKSWCVLVSDTHSQTAISRLNVMTNEYDGFEIAESDLRLRGPGDFIAASFGESSALRQSGVPSLDFSRLFSDSELLSCASDIAQELIKADPELNSPENAPLLAETFRLFNINRDLIS